MNVVSFSGGKDSTAMLLMMVERQERIHSIVYFDTEWEFPEIQEHIRKIERDIDIPFVRVRHWAGFEFLLKRYGPPHPSGGWCTAAKRDVLVKYQRMVRKRNPDIVPCIGFTVDEKHRAKRMQEKWPVRYPLIEYGETEESCLQYCYDRGYDFGGIYDWMPSKRVSCYCCPKQSNADRAAIRKHHP